MEKRTHKPVRDPSCPSEWDVEELASATECTGLIPAAIQTQDEAEDYSRLYAIHVQKTAWGNEQETKDKKK